MPPKGAPGAPRPQHSRKPSIASPDKVKKSTAKENKEKASSSKDMPPPPPPKPAAILEPEVNALEDCLKNVTVSTAQIFKFYADTKRLGVQRHVANLPRTLTLSLEHELRRYDQICDTLESEVSRAIAVLQRDLAREEERIREEEAEKARVRAAEPPQIDTDIEMGPPSEVPGAVSDTQSQAPSQASPPSGAITGAGRAPLRRPSTLHRNPFPLKLDLPSSALRLESEDGGGLDISSLGDLGSLSNIGSLAGITGLASPVTLAPKSARAMGPGELPPEILAAFASATTGGMSSNPPDSQSSQMQQMHDQQTRLGSAQNIDIDLTLDDTLSPPIRTGMDILSAGSSVDKPITLDLDLDVQMSELEASDIFGPESQQHPQQTNTSGTEMGQSSSVPDVTDVDSLFSPATGRSNELPGDSTEGMDMNLLNALSQNQEDTDAFLASLGGGEAEGAEGQNGAIGPQPSSSGDQSSLFDNSNTVGDTREGNTDFDYSQLDMGDLFSGSSSEGMDMMKQLLEMSENGHVEGAEREGGGGNDSSEGLKDGGIGNTSKDGNEAPSESSTAQNPKAI